MSKLEQLGSLYKSYKSEFNSEEIVLGDGNSNADLLLIGEAPGKDEVRLSKPFVGAAGKNLSEFLGILGIERETIYITNTIKYRLSKLNTETGRIINRPATKEEIIKSRDYLLQEIRIINPKYIVTLGNVPLKAVMGDFNASIGSMHGNLKVIEVLEAKYNLFPLYHPASVIYNSKLKDIYTSDIKKLGEIIKID
ncbi:MAG: uracil-DNA glycosylase [Clostridia bacterium]|nr:uracil-DNA glycosylase [Clostridia bacterium]